MADRLALFVRAPLHGAVKTRLARAIGADAALSAHETLVEHALANLSGAGEFELQIWGSESHPRLTRWSAERQLPLAIQRGENLGMRMHDALDRLGQQGHRAVIVGSDCPTVDVEYAQAAFAALDTADLVLGPAEDGGYGLIGIRQLPVPDVFSGVTWGSSAVLQQTLSLAHAEALQVKLLPALWDVDEHADWLRFQRRYQLR